MKESDNISREPYYRSRDFTAEHGFTSGIEGPATDAQGNLYAVNFASEHTIGRVTPEGECSVFVELPNGSIGNGIRFTSKGEMLIADYTNHNILQVDMQTRQISVFAHEPSMSQPNDICITPDDVVFASDPDWQTATGRLWRIDRDGVVTLMEADMGTTNGIEVTPDGKTLYVNESVQRRIYKYELTPDHKLLHKKLVIEFPDYGLDGMRCDLDGNLYVTRWGKGTVVKLSPEGAVIAEIELIGKNCTNLTFGGIDGRTCYVTVADRGNIETFRVETPGRCWLATQGRWGRRKGNTDTR
ncbi:SMP-30/gluconolactonase/LRE family protein [Paenibacillus cymbidii]|uniref:SMP-30/gluconolactonase/LRE family protein n=1 Tax=Paenibacillus cymbidii TaxID=1639034 RepID=UPI0010804DD5|nr:SMP-30/gluconolactonase/LRE family protein [Paenibacillus cymbidii]